MDYNEAARIIPDVMMVTDEEIRRELNEIFSNYYLTDRQCEIIFLLLREFRHEIAEGLINELKISRLKNVKKNVLYALSINRFGQRTGDMGVAVLNSYSKGYLKKQDIIEIKKQAEMLWDNLLEEKRSGVNALIVYFDDILAQAT